MVLCVLMMPCTESEWTWSRCNQSPYFSGMVQRIAAWENHLHCLNQKWATNKQTNNPTQINKFPDETKHTDKNRWKRVTFSLLGTHSCRRFFMCISRLRQTSHTHVQPCLYLIYNKLNTLFHYATENLFMRIYNSALLLSAKTFADNKSTRFFSLNSLLLLFFCFFASLPNWDQIICVGLRVRAFSMFYSAAWTHSKPQ